MYLLKKIKARCLWKGIFIFLLLHLLLMNDCATLCRVTCAKAGWILSLHFLWQVLEMLQAWALVFEEEMSVTHHDMWSSNKLFQSCILNSNTLANSWSQLLRKIHILCSSMDYTQNIWISHEGISTNKDWGVMYGFLFQWISLESVFISNTRNSTVEKMLDLELKLEVRFWVNI